MKVMTLRIRLVTLAITVTVSGLPLGAQQAQPAGPQPQSPVAVMPDRPQPEPDTPQGGRQFRPLTAMEERERALRLLDPKAAVDPATGLRIQDIPSVVPDSRGPEAPPSTPDRNGTPLRGSVAESGRRPVNPRNAGPTVSAEETNLDSPDYTGPAVLTRAYTLQRPAVPEQLRFRYSLGLNEAYDSGNQIYSQRDPDAPRTGRLGQDVSWTLSGRHYWRKDILGLNYYGGSAKNPSVNQQSTSHSMSADYSHILSRRLQFHMVTSGSVLSSGFALQNPVLNPTNSLANIDVASSPVVQIFDSTTRQLQIGPSLQWSKSARLSVSIGGGWFGIERDGTGLTGQTGYQAQADLNYRITRRSTVGTYYSTTFYRYSQKVAVSDSHTNGVLFSSSLDRSTQIRLRAGLTRFENRGLARVQIAPEIARLLGTSVGVVDEYRRNLYAELSGELARDFHRHRTATMSYSRSLAPGNGLILASVQQSAGIGYNMLSFRRYATSAGLGWSTLSSAVQTAEKYETRFVFFGISRPVGRYVTSSLRIDYRRFAITSALGTPDQLRVTMGFSWSPGDGPPRLW